ncbi:PEP-CTERM protein-sorting domain-containing protein/XapX domain-containing protein [Caldanaerobius fijiensis DSM 17918]|uniref:PEP-CTERM protein-sorting domain-containing protein/XapX domain-containing protein n=1 Tax=Caldanaerobius fijiensis DSM 17918 TaxID=1121256 RepID=A0A1M5EQ03_9THEO|nr:XapX domain-containing protein [Caldanaerobius fijiensis]SHF81204.1 PEP-CTERM protein-sorting domain-containing protein/XapX domain-containing protein [Caldanaerobius fijiensis DSM 17918]
MMTILLTMLAGAILGATFKKLRLPLPAPATLSGVLGVLGVLLGSMLAKLF